MLVTEHKHPVMSTRNRLHEFLVDDACALACSGMLRKSEKIKDIYRKYWDGMTAASLSYRGNATASA